MKLAGGVTLLFAPYLLNHTVLDAEHPQDTEVNAFIDPAVVAVIGEV